MRPETLMMDVAAETAYVPSVTSIDGRRTSLEVAFPKDPTLERDLDLVVWKAATGTYRHRPVATSEVAYFIAGRGTFELDGIGSIEIGPGRLLFVPAGVSGRFQIEEPLQAVVIAPMTQPALSDDGLL
jgi:uncharacterized cupin superfamily protein